MVNIGNKVIFRGSGNTNTIELVPRKKKCPGKRWTKGYQSLHYPCLLYRPSWGQITWWYCDWKIWNPGLECSQGARWRGTESVDFSQELLFQYVMVFLRGEKNCEKMTIKSIYVLSNWPLFQKVSIEFIGPKEVSTTRPVNRQWWR